MQQVAVITLGIADLERSLAFYRDGFGWEPVFRNDEIAFYQMNGLVLGTWLKDRLAGDMQRDAVGTGALALAHNVRAEEEVQPLIDRLVQAGGALLRESDHPPHGGCRGYVADPDGHAWEIAFNPAWPIAEDGRVTFRA